MRNIVKIYDKLSASVRDVSINEFSDDLNKQRNFVLIPESKVTIAKDDDIREVTGGEAYSYLRDGFSIYDKNYKKAHDIASSRSGFVQGAISGVSMDINTLFDDDVERTARLLTKEQKSLSHKVGYGTGMIAGALGSGGIGALAKGVSKVVSIGGRKALELGLKTKAGQETFKIANMASNGLGKISESQAKKVIQGISIASKSKISKVAQAGGEVIKKTGRAGQVLKSKPNLYENIAKGASKVLDYTPIHLASKTATKLGEGVAKKTGSKFLGARASDIAFGVGYGIAPAIEEKNPWLVAENAVFTGVVGGALGGVGTGVTKTLSKPLNYFAGDKKRISKFLTSSLDKNILNISNDKQFIQYHASSYKNIKKYLENSSPEYRKQIMNEAGVKYLGNMTKKDSLALTGSILSKEKDLSTKFFSKSRGGIADKVKLDLKVSANEMKRIQNSVSDKTSGLSSKEILHDVSNTIKISKDKGALQTYRKQLKLKNSIIAESLDYITNQYMTKNGNFSSSKLSEILKGVDKSKFINVDPKMRTLLKESGLSMNKIFDDDVFYSLLKNKQIDGIGLNKKELIKYLHKNHKFKHKEFDAIIKNVEGRTAKLFNESVAKKKPADVVLLEKLSGTFRDRQEGALKKSLSKEDYSSFLKEKGRYGLFKTIENNILNNPVKSESSFFIRDQITTAGALLGLGGLLGGYNIGGASGATIGLGIGFSLYYMNKTGYNLLKARSWTNSLAKNMNSKALAFKNLSNHETYKKFKPAGSSFRGMTFNQIGESLIGRTPKNPEDFQSALYNAVTEYSGEETGGVDYVVKEFLNQAGVNDDKLNSYIDYKAHNMRQVVLEELIESFKETQYQHHPRIKSAKEKLDRNKRKFEDNVSVIFSPDSVASYIRESKLTNRMIHNFKSVFPEKYQEMQVNLIIAYKNGNLNLTRKQTLTLSRFLGYDLTGTKGVTSDSGDSTSSIKEHKNIQRKIKESEGQQSTTQKIETL